MSHVVTLRVSRLASAGRYKKDTKIVEHTKSNWGEKKKSKLIAENEPNAFKTGLRKVERNNNHAVAWTKSENPIKVHKCGSTSQTSRFFVYYSPNKGIPAFHQPLGSRKIVFRQGHDSNLQSPGHGPHDSASQFSTRDELTFRKTARKLLLSSLV